MNDLNLLLRDLTTDAPPDSFDPGSLLRTARARVRRRRAAGFVGVVAAAAAIAVAPLATSGRHPVETGPLAQADQTLTPADAVPAEAGRDYAVLARYAGRDRDTRLEGRFVRGVLPDGTVVLQEYGAGLGPNGRIVLAAASERATRPAPAKLDNYLGAAAGQLFFGRDGNDLWMLRRDTMTWHAGSVGEALDTNVPTQAQYPSTGSLVLAGGAVFGEGTRALHQLEVRSPGVVTGPVKPLAGGGDVAVSGSLVAWTRTYGDRNDRVTILDRATGARTSFDPRTGSCVPKGLAIAGDRVVVTVNCADRPHDSSETNVVDHVLVYDRSGRALTSIDLGRDGGGVSATDRQVTFWTQEGVFAFSLLNDRLLRLAGPSQEASWTVAGSGDRVSWYDAGHHEYVVARMR